MPSLDNRNGMKTANYEVYKIYIPTDNCLTSMLKILTHSPCQTCCVLLILRTKQNKTFQKWS